MFTGIVEHIGTVVHAETAPGGGRRLRVDLGPIASTCRCGDSIAVSGVCLTVAHLAPPCADFDVIPETIERSTLGSLRTGDGVNLERSLGFNGRIDGHFVQGHIDGVAVVDHVRAQAGEHVLTLRAASEHRPYLIPKGSVAIDGVSLTIASLSGDCFSVALIPTTLERTTLSRLRPGAHVNLETDIIVRTIVHQLSNLTGGVSGLTRESLARAGLV